MSKSLGNLVFVSDLLEAGTDPMAIRLAVLAHRYGDDWDWTDEGLAAAAARLGRWREAARTQKASAGHRANAAGSEVAGAEVLRAMRERLADDLDAPGALAVVDQWADEVLAGPNSAGDAGVRPAAAAPAEADSGPSAANLVPDAVDALLGVAL
jgi:L-cysteine:1D-myo-inositol 2-amino-2-deoxy-alpha-D-glucopyranoside ligase